MSTEKKKFPFPPVVIWEPRYHDKNEKGYYVLLVDNAKIRKGKNFILVALGEQRGNIFEFDSEDVINCGEQPNSGIICRVIPEPLCKNVTEEYEVTDTDAEKEGCIVLWKDKTKDKTGKTVDAYHWRIAIEQPKPKKKKKKYEYEDVPVTYTDEELRQILLENMEAG